MKTYICFLNQQTPTWKMAFKKSKMSPENHPLRHLLESEVAETGKVLKDNRITRPWRWLALASTSHP